MSPSSESLQHRIDAPAARHGLDGDPIAAAVPCGYKVVSQAGRGTFCDNWQIREEATGRCFSLKQLRPEWQDDPDGRQLLANEAHIGCLFHSPYVVQIVKYDIECHRPYIIAEWLDGSALEEILLAGGALEWTAGLWISRQCAAGLNDLQREGFAHGDVKPENILLSGDGGIKLLDLGFNRPTQRKRKTDKTDSQQPAAHKRLVTGTADYLAPEVLSRGEYDPVTADVYSFGVTLYRIFSGRLPFYAENMAEMLRRHREVRAVPVGELVPDLPTTLSDLVMRMLSKQPLRRPDGFGDPLRELIALEVNAMSQSNAQARGAA